MRTQNVFGRAEPKWPHMLSYKEVPCPARSLAENASPHPCPCLAGLVQAFALDTKHIPQCRPNRLTVHPPYRLTSWQNGGQPFWMLEKPLPLFTLLCSCPCPTPGCAGQERSNAIFKVFFIMCGIWKCSLPKCHSPLVLCTCLVHKVKMDSGGPSPISTCNSYLAWLAVSIYKGKLLTILKGN